MWPPFIRFFFRGGSGGAATLLGEVIAVAAADAAVRTRGVGRASVAVQLPAVLASAGLLLVAAGPYSTWALATWLLGGVGAARRAGERLALRWRGFRPLIP